MNKKWSELNKMMQIQLKKESTFNLGIENLLKLRKLLFSELLDMKKQIDREAFNACPFINAKGYHNKTIIYSIWHIFRIEDIVVHTLIKGDEQIFLLNDFKERIGSSIITTGNELIKQQIIEFSKELDLDEIYCYISTVKKSTDDMLKKIKYQDLRCKIAENKKVSLKALNVVSDDENAHWLIDYWCNKDLGGLVKMPLSRHWIMHIEACLRIKNKLV